MSIRDQIAAKRAEAQKTTERTNGRLGASSTNSNRGRVGTSNAQEGLEERTVVGQIRKAHKSGKLDISSFSLEAVPPDVYTRLLGISPADLSRPVPAAPAPERKPNDPSKRVPPEAGPKDSREQIFGLPAREVDWGEGTELIALKAADNALTELEKELGAFGGLKSIDLSKNQLSSLPTSFADLLRLTSIDLSSNRLTELPPSVLLLPALHTLDLSHNLVSSLDFSSPVAPTEEGLSYGAGFLTTSFGRVSSDSRPIWPALVSLDLSYNELRTEHLAALRQVKLGALTKLNLTGNKLAGEIQAADVGLDGKNAPSLSTLILDHNKGLVSFNGARTGCAVEMEGCNIVTNSSAPLATESAGPSTSIPRTKGLPVPQPDLTIVYKTCPAATFDSEPLSIDFDLYLPPEPPGPSGHPLVVWFHGGGLLQGNKENLPPHFRRLPSHPYTTSKGIERVAVISPNYRLAPQVPILDILGDIDALMEYIRTKLNTKLRAYDGGHKIDVDRICLSGGSAGGYLALVAGLTIPKSIRDSEVGGYRGDAGKGIKCLAPFYPITDLTDPFWAEKTDPVPWFGRHVADEEARPHLDLKSPPIATAVSGGPRSILYMYMLQHGVFPSLLFLKQRSVTSGGETFRPDPESLSLSHRLDLIDKSRDKPALPPVYFVYGTVDRAVQPQDRAIEALSKVTAVNVEKLEGADHAYDEDPEVECEAFREWLGVHLM